MPPFGEQPFNIGHEVFVIEDVLIDQFCVSLRLSDDAHSVPEYLPEHGLANRRQIDEVYGTPSRFSYIRDELYLLVGSHRAIAHDGDIYITITSCSARRDRTKNVGQLDVGMLPKGGLNLPDCHTNLPNCRAGEIRRFDTD